MSDAVYPALDGLAFDVERAPEFVTLIQRSLGGNEARISYYTTPISHWTLIYTFLDAADYALLKAFYIARCGSAQSFLFSDTSEAQAVLKATVPATGTGTEEHFQIDRMVEGTAYTSNVLMPVPLIYVGGVLRTTNYFISTADLITFTAPLPGNGVAVAWSGDLYHRVRFDTDMLSFNEFMSQLWEIKQLDLVGVR